MSQTTPTAALAYGREPGLRFACLLDGSGHGADLDGSMSKYGRSGVVRGVGGG